MNRISNLIKHTLGIVVAMCLLTLVSACGDGSDGAQGPAGPTGDAGPPGPTGDAGPAQPSEITDKMFAEITGATIAADGTTTVTFTMANDDGYPFIGLASNRIRFTFAQLMPADPVTGEPTKWQSYVNRVEDAPTDPDLGSGTEAQFQATYESGGVFTDNLDGSYTYVFDVNPTAATDPLAVTYNADYTHRVAFQISGGGFPTLNRTYDWQPSTGLTDGITSREMVVEETCNACHGTLAIHGGGRVDTAYCVTCHNPGSIDANSGNTVDMPVMVHKIHMGANLPSVQDGGEYAIWGYRDSKHDYSGVHIPMDVRNCTSCHDDAIAETPDAINWKNMPTIQACGACHDDVNFATGAGHEGGAFADNSECATCHMDGRLSSITDAHTAVMAAKVAVASEVTAAVESLSIDQVTGDVAAVVRIQIDGVNVPALRDGSDVDTDEGAVLGTYRSTDNGALAINWDNGTGFQYTHQEVAFNDCVPDGSGLFTCSAAGLLAGITDTDVVTVTTVDLLICMNEKDGMIAACDTPESDDVRVAQVPVVPEYYSFTGDGVATTDDYDKVAGDIDSCRSCHVDNKFHHAATDLVQCKTCHNATRLSYRAGQPGDLKHNVHRLHASLAGRRLLPNPDGEDYDFYFPGNISQCTACHTADQVELPVAVNNRAAVARGAGGQAKYTSPTAVVCSACHLDIQTGYVDPTLQGLIDPAIGSISLETQAVIDHMIQNGAVFGATTFEEANKVESCAVCHAKGKDVGIDKVHKFSN